MSILPHVLPFVPNMPGGFILLFIIIVMAALAAIYLIMRKRK